MDFAFKPFLPFRALVDMRTDLRIWKHPVRPFLLTLTLGLGLISTGCEQREAVSLEQRIDNARAARSEGNLRTAIVELKNGLRDNPDSAAARYLLGQIYIEMENGAAADKELSKAEELGVDREAVIIPLSRAWILKGDFQKVLDEVQISINMPMESRSALHVVRGDAYYGLGAFDQAEEEYDRAVELHEGNALGFVGLANVALRRTDSGEAARLLALALKHDPNNLRVITLEGDVSAAQGRYDEAVAAYRRLVKIRPENVLYRTVLAWAEVNVGDLAEAGKNIDRVLAVVPEYPPAHHIKAVIAFRTKQFASARDYASKVLSVAPDRMSTLLVLGASSYALGNMELAYNSLRRYVTGVPGDEVGRKLLSQVQIALGRSEEALETLNPLLGEEKEDKELFNLVAKASLLKGDLKTGREYLQKTLESEPGSTETMTALGRTQIALGNVDQGLAELERAVKLDPNAYSRRMMLALEYLRNQRLDNALAEARAMQSIDPEKPAGYTLEGMALGIKGDEAAAVKAFQAALKVAPGNANASLNLVRYAIQDEDWSRVKKLLEGVLDARPNDMRALLAYAGLMRRNGDTVKAREYLEKAVSSHPEARQPTILLAQSYLTSGDYAKGLEVARKIFPIYARDAALLEVIGRLEVASGQVENALVTFGNLVDVRPDSAIAHFYLAEALERQGNWVGAERTLKRVLELDPGYVSARFAMVRVLAAQGRLPEAEARLEALAADYPDEPEFIETKGVIAAISGHYQTAIPVLGRAFELRKNSVNARRLAETYARSGQVDAGIRILRDWLDSYPQDAATRFVLAGLKMSKGDYPQAETQYRKILAENPQDANALNNLAYALGEMGQMQAALDEIGKALKIAPENTSVLDTAGTLYLKAGRPLDAVSVLRKASALESRNMNFREHYARALIAAGREGEARSVLSELLRSPYPIEDRGSVEKLYMELTSE